MRHLKAILLTAILASCAGGIEPSKPEPVPPTPDCGHACISGSCFEGRCRCLRDAECDVSAQCKNGVCLQPEAAGRICSSDAECGIRHACVRKRCTPTPCLDEICDGFDNDCDGAVDETEETDRACYTGPAGTKDVGVCRGGTQSCVNGSYAPCLGETTPLPEAGFKRCDALDNDCDGCIDGTSRETAACHPAADAVDIVFMVDNSGSMSAYMTNVKDASKALASKFRGDPRVRFGLVNVADRYAFGHIGVVAPLSDFDTFRAALDAMPGDGYGTEPTYDAVWRTASGMFDAELGFTPDSFRAYILMADEGAKTVWSPPVTEASMCAEVVSRDVLLTVVTKTAHFGDWDACAAGRLFEISLDPAATTADLEKILGLSCL